MPGETDEREYNITRRQNEREKREQTESVGKNLQRQNICAPIHVSYVRERAKKVCGGIELEAEKLCQEEGGEMVSVQREKRKKDMKGGRGRIRKEADDDVTMALTPPAPTLHWGCLSVQTNTHNAW